MFIDIDCHCEKNGHNPFIVREWSDSKPVGKKIEQLMIQIFEVIRYGFKIATIYVFKRISAKIEKP